jgi:DNA-binding IclR family transcriptional regulator
MASAFDLMKPVLSDVPSTRADRGGPVATPLSTRPTAHAGGPTRTVDRALELLALVCEGDAPSLSECARRSQLPASTALRLLRTLEVRGFVRRDEQGCFIPGTRVLQVGAQALSRQGIVRLTEPGLRRIVAATGESAYLSMRGPDDTVVYVAVAEGTRPVRHISWVGRSVPMEGLAVGAVLDGRTPASGYVAERDRQEPDVTAVVAPVVWRGGVAGAVSVLGPTYRIPDETMQDFGRIVRAEARLVSEQLGDSASAPPRPAPAPRGGPR